MQFSSWTKIKSWKRNYFRWVWLSAFTLCKCIKNNHLFIFVLFFPSFVVRLSFSAFFFLCSPPIYYLHQQICLMFMWSNGIGIECKLPIEIIYIFPLNLYFVHSSIIGKGSIGCLILSHQITNKSKQNGGKFLIKISWPLVHVARI